jgi:hypothetical protein
VGAIDSGVEVLEESKEEAEETVFEKIDIESEKVFLKSVKQGLGFGLGLFFAVILVLIVISIISAAILLSGLIRIEDLYSIKF